jgi:hypothetical protein
MAGRPAKKAQPQPKPFDEFAEEGEGFEDDVAAVDAKGNPLPPGRPSRDWRDVEKFREDRELKKLIGEDLDDLFDDKPRKRRG